jgi:hypothetical protein
MDLIEEIESYGKYHQCKFCGRSYNIEDKQIKCEKNCSEELELEKGNFFEKLMKNKSKIRKRKKFFNKKYALIEFSVTGKLTDAIKIKDFVAEFHKKHSDDHFYFLGKEGFLLNIIQNGYSLKNFEVSKNKPKSDKEFLTLNSLFPDYKDGKEVLVEISNGQELNPAFKESLIAHYDNLNSLSNRGKVLALLYYYLHQGLIKKFNYFYQLKCNLNKLDFIIEELEDYKNELNAEMGKKMDAKFDYFIKMYPFDENDEKISKRETDILKEKYKYNNLSFKGFFPVDDILHLYDEISIKDPLIIISEKSNDEMYVLD